MIFPPSKCPYATKWLFPKRPTTPTVNLLSIPKPKFQV